VVGRDLEVGKLLVAGQSDQVSRVELEIVILSEVRERKINIILYCLYGEPDTNELIYKTETDSQT